MWSKSVFVIQKTFIILKIETCAIQQEFLKIDEKGYIINPDPLLDTHSWSDGLLVEVATSFHIRNAKRSEHQELCLGPVGVNTRLKSKVESCSSPITWSMKFPFEYLFSFNKENDFLTCYLIHEVSWPVTWSMSSSSPVIWSTKFPLEYLFSFNKENNFLFQRKNVCWKKAIIDQV